MQFKEKKKKKGFCGTETDMPILEKLIILVQMHFTMKTQIGIYILH